MTTSPVPHGAAQPRSRRGRQLAAAAIVGYTAAITSGVMAAVFAAAGITDPPVAFVAGAALIGFAAVAVALDVLAQRARRVRHHHTNSGVSARRAR